MEFKRWNRGLRGHPENQILEDNVELTGDVKDTEDGSCSDARGARCPSFSTMK